MHPILLDNHSLSTEFEAFIEAIDDMHELTLDGNQQLPVLCWSTFFFFPCILSCFLTLKLITFMDLKKLFIQGVYALLFLKRRVRGVAHRLASSMGKLR